MTPAASATKRSRKPRERVGGVGRLGGGAAQRTSATSSPPVHSGFSGSRWPKWPSSGSTTSSTSSPAGARRVREALAHRQRDDVVARAVGQQRGHAEREPLGRRGGGVALRAPPPAFRRGSGARRRREPQLRRHPQVEHAGLRDDARRPPRARRSRVASHAASWPPAECPIATTRARSSTPWSVRGHLGEVVDRRGDVVQRARVAAARERPSRRYSTFHAAQPRAARSAHSGVRLLAAVAAPARSRRGARPRRGTGRRRRGRKSSPNCAASPSVRVTLRQRHPASAPPRRAA